LSELARMPRLEERGIECSRTAACKPEPCATKLPKIGLGPHAGLAVPN